MVSNRKKKAQERLIKLGFSKQKKRASSTMSIIVSNVTHMMKRSIQFAINAVQFFQSHRLDCIKVPVQSRHKPKTQARTTKSRKSFAPTTKRGDMIMKCRKIKRRGKVLRLTTTLSSSSARKIMEEGKNSHKYLLSSF